MRLNDLAAIPIPAPAKRPSELGALKKKTQSTGSVFGNQPKEVDIVSFIVELGRDSLNGQRDTVNYNRCRRFTTGTCSARLVSLCLFLRA